MSKQKDAVPVGSSSWVRFFAWFVVGAGEVLLWTIRVTCCCLLLFLLGAAVRETYCDFMGNWKTALIVLAVITSLCVLTLGLAAIHEWARRVVGKKSNEKDQAQNPRNPRSDASL